MDEVTCLKLQLDRWDLPQSPLLDAHTPASLLKLWYRELYEPLIPDTLYGECVLHCESPSKVLNLVERLPELNRLVLCYLIHFLQVSFI
jgi:RhoGAP domain.